MILSQNEKSIMKPASKEIRRLDKRGCLVTKFLLLSLLLLCPILLLLIVLLFPILIDIFFSPMSDFTRSNSIVVTYFYWIIKNNI